jgi:hypothetical protein
MKRILIGFIIAITVFLAVGLLLPDEMHIERSMNLQEDRQHVFNLIQDLTRWKEWDGISQIDSVIEEHFSDEPKGHGAHYAWKSKGKDGLSGKVTLDMADDSNRVNALFEFDKMKEVALGTLQLYPAEDGTTKVQYKFSVKVSKNPVARWMAFLMRDKIEQKMNQGLMNLERVAMQDHAKEQQAETTPTEEPLEMLQDSLQEQTPPQDAQEDSLENVV